MRELQMKFISAARDRLVVRTDAVDAHAIDHENLLRVTLPLNPARMIETGMDVVFYDGGELNIYEVRNTSTSVTDQVQEIEAESIGQAELRDWIVPSISVKKVEFQGVVALILSGSGWVVGDIPTDLPPAEYSYYTWKVATGSSLKLTLRKSPSSNSSALGYYSNGTRVKQISIYNSTWMKVQVVGKTGYMARSSLTDRVTVTVAGLPMITLNQKFGVAYDLLTAVLDKVGLRPSFRVEYSGGVLTRYVDMVYTRTDLYRGARIELDRNVAQDGVEYDDRELYTAVYATGKDGLTFSSVVWTTASGKPADKPSGQTYVEDVGATALYGRGGIRRTAYLKFSDEDSASDLLDSAWRWLQEHNAPSVSVQLRVIDLARLGLSGQPLLLGERVNVLLHPIGSAVYENVVELDRDLLNPENTLPVIGNYHDDVVSEVSKNTEEITELKNEQDIKIEELTAKVPFIKYGSVATTDGTASVSFSGFASNPRVVAQLVRNSSTEGDDALVVVTSVSTTGASFKVHYDGTAPQSINIHWVAIGTPAA